MDHARPLSPVSPNTKRMRALINGDAHDVPPSSMPPSLPRLPPLPPPPPSPRRRFSNPHHGLMREFGGVRRWCAMYRGDAPWPELADV